MRAGAVLAAGVAVLAAVLAVLTACAGPAARPPDTVASRTWWHPGDPRRGGGPEFQWELGHALDVGSARDLGTGAVNAAGKRAADPAVYDIDGIDNTAATVAALHRRHDKVICYIEVGAAGNYYQAQAEGRPVTYYAQLSAAGVLGRKVPGYPERYLDINSPGTVAIIKEMIRRQCTAKGFDAVEPDIDDSYTDSTGFPVTEADSERYDKALAAYAHGLGLAWGQKNGDGDPAFSRALAGTADFLLDEECQFYRRCPLVASPYLRAGKLVLDAEYTDDWGGGATAALRKFCAADEASGIDGTLFTPALDGWRAPCR